MTLQDVANALNDAEALAYKLPASAERHAVIARIQKAYALVLGLSDELKADVAALRGDVHALLDGLERACP